MLTTTTTTLKLGGLKKVLEKANKKYPLVESKAEGERKRGDENENVHSGRGGENTLSTVSMIAGFDG